MKAFSILAAAVLAVVGVGVAVAPGLSGYQLPPAKTFSLDGFRVSVEFPGVMTYIAGGPLVTTSGTSLLVAGTGDDRHLQLDISTLSKSGSSPLIDYLWEQSFKTHATCAGLASLDPQLRGRPGAHLCTYGEGWSHGNVGFVVDALSTEGMVAARDVVQSFRILGPVAKAP